jgi:hypothetical protein
MNPIAITEPSTRSGGPPIAIAHVPPPIDGSRIDPQLPVPAS